MAIEYWNPTPIGFYDVDENEKMGCYLEYLNNKTTISSLMEKNVWGDLVSSTLYKNKNILALKEFGNFFNLITKYVNQFCVEINHNLKTEPVYILESWFNSLEKFGFQDAHSHSDSVESRFLSGVYYFDLDSSIEEGIVFRMYEKDNYFFIKNGYRLVKYDYIPGRIIIFPSTLEHKVPFKKSDGVRLSVSFNIKIVSTKNV